MLIQRSLFSFIAALIVFFIISSYFSSSRSASFEEEAIFFVDEIADKAIKQLTEKEVSRDERVKRFKTFFNNHFAVIGIGKWIIGRYWRQATEKEREEYIALFEDMVAFFFVDRFLSYAGKPLHIHTSLVQDDKNVTIFSDIHQKNGAPAIRVDWRVARKDDSIKIVDVVIEGTSMSNTLRSDFGSIIRSRGHKISGLLEALREKTTKLRKQALD
jgi:phospholipid transport system substrate-binding protein